MTVSSPRVGTLSTAARKSLADEIVSPFLERQKDCAGRWKDKRRKSLSIRLQHAPDMVCPDGNKEKTMDNNT